MRGVLSNELLYRDTFTLMVLGVAPFLVRLWYIPGRRNRTYEGKTPDRDVSLTAL
jgi:hypothetical protein